MDESMPSQSSSKNQEKITKFLKPLNKNRTKWSNTLKNSLAKAEELFECVWHFVGVKSRKEKKLRSRLGPDAQLLECT